MPTNPLAWLFDPPRFRAVDAYPELRPLLGAVRADDWAAITAYFAGRPAGEDPSTAVHAVSAVRGSEKFLQRMVDTQRSPLARTLMGARLIKVGWAFRSAYLARHVSQAQFEAFHDHLRRADRLLAEATADDPTSVAAWTQRLKTCRGLGFGLDEARRRYAMVAKRHPAPYFAQSQLLQQLCPKWGGTFDAVDEFARECLMAAPDGALSGAVVAEAYIEYRTEQTTVRPRSQPMWDDLTEAATRSVLHPASRREHGWVQAHNSFAAAWTLAGHPDAAAVHFMALGRLATEYPWSALGPTAAGEFIRARRAALRSVK